MAVDGLGDTGADGGLCDTGADFGEIDEGADDGFGLQPTVETTSGFDVGFAAADPCSGGPW